MTCNIFDKKIIVDKIYMRCRDVIEMDILAVI